MLKSVAIGVVVLIITAGSCWAQTMPVPTGQEYIEYDPIELGVVSADPAQARPLSVGPVAKGGENMNITLSLPAFSAPVDIFVAVQAPELLPDLFLLWPDNSIRLLSEGFVPWKAHAVGPIDESLFGVIPSSVLPGAIYYVYLAVMPASGAQSASGIPLFRLWRTFAPNAGIFGELRFFYGYDIFTPGEPPVNVNGDSSVFFWVDSSNVFHTAPTASLAIEGGGGGQETCPWTISGAANIDVLRSSLLVTSGNKTLEIQLGYQISETWTNTCPEIPPRHTDKNGTDTYALPFENGASLASEALLIDVYLSIYRNR